jgi:hypothetical protein
VFSLLCLLSSALLSVADRPGATGWSAKRLKAEQRGEAEGTAEGTAESRADKPAKTQTHSTNNSAHRAQVDTQRGIDERRVGGGGRGEEKRGRAEGRLGQ